MSKLKNLMNKILEYICVFIFAFITAVGTYQIVTRYIFNAPSTKSEELLTYGFTWLALFAASYVFGKREHMRMSFLADKASDKNKIILAIISESVVILFSAIVLIYGGFSITKLTMTQRSASLGIPMGWIYSIVPISGIVTVIYNIININEMLSDLNTVNKSLAKGGSK